MKTYQSVSKVIRVSAWIIIVILVLMPFHALLTVWLASLAGHYTLLRLWKEFLLAGLSLGCLYLLIVDTELRKKLFGFWPARLIGVYTLVLLVWGAIALATSNVNAKALAYGLLIDTRFLIFFLLVWLIASRCRLLSKKWAEILLIPAAAVVVFGLAQHFLLPYDFLKHFGYGPDTISPYETINHNLNYIRIASTLRGANPLGSYLVIPLSVLSILLIKTKFRRRARAVLYIGVILTLIFSYSRSAWVGAAASVLVIGWVALKTSYQKRLAIWLAVAVVTIGGLSAFALRHNTTFEDAFLHTDHKSQVLTSSNQGHSAAFKDAAHDITHQPLGSGPGSAGPASVYNNHPPRIAENYFLQIGQETGIIGMGLFIAINVLVGQLLWMRRADYLSLALFGSLIGLTLVNLLSHAWADDTLAYVWWGLAGIALAPAIIDSSHKHKNAKTEQKAT